MNQSVSVLQSSSKLSNRQRPLGDSFHVDPSKKQRYPQLNPISHRKVYSRMETPMLSGSQQERLFDLLVINPKKLEKNPLDE